LPPLTLDQPSLAQFVSPALTLAHWPLAVLSRPPLSA